MKERHPAPVSEQHSERFVQALSRNDEENPVWWKFRFPAGQVGRSCALMA
jgi:hypothetical protein